MVTTNFTISGNMLECVARVQDGKPVFDLYIKDDPDGAELVRGVEYDRFVDVCKGMAEELNELACEWKDGGELIRRFHTENRAEASAYE